MSNTRPQTIPGQMRNRLLPNLDAGTDSLTKRRMNIACNVTKPLGVRTYQLAEALPPELNCQLPNVEELERELEGLGGGNSGE